MNRQSISHRSILPSHFLAWLIVVSAECNFPGSTGDAGLFQAQPQAIQHILPVVRAEAHTTGGLRSLPEPWNGSWFVCECCAILSVVSHRHPCVTNMGRWSEWTHPSRQRSGASTRRWLTIQDLELNLWPQQHSQRRTLRVSLSSLSGDRGRTAAAAEGPWSCSPFAGSRGSLQILVLPEPSEAIRR